MAGGLNLYRFANGDPVNFSDPFGLCHTVTEEQKKKECKLRDPAETENKELDALEKERAGSASAMCRQASGALAELRRQGRVQFYDREFRDGKLLYGDSDALSTGPVHLYSGHNSNWTPS